MTPTPTAVGRRHDTPTRSNTGVKYIYEVKQGFRVMVRWAGEQHRGGTFETLEAAKDARTELLATLSAASKAPPTPAPKPQPQVHRPKMDDPDDDDGPFVGEPPLTVRGSREMYWAAWKRIHVLPPEKYPCETTSASSVASLQVAS